MKEKEKGKTIEIGKTFFETEHSRFTLLDAPRHAGYIPYLLQGVCQKDSLDWWFLIRKENSKLVLTKVVQLENILYY